MCLLVTVDKTSLLALAHVEIVQPYPLELHTVVTEDGFITALYRIPAGDEQSVLGQNTTTEVLIS
jgi:hypothetical protein